MIQLEDVHFLSNAVMVPLLKVMILLDKCGQPTKVIVFLNIGASCSMINLDILPPNHWQKTHKVFRIISGEIITISKILKAVKLKLFPGYEVKNKLYRSFAPDRDVLVGFDVINQMLKIRSKLN